MKSSEHKYEKKKTGRKAIEISEESVDELRRTAHEIMKNGEYLTIQTLSTKIQDKEGIPAMSETTLWRKLRAAGFTYRVNRRNMAMLLEKVEGRDARFRFYEQFEQYLNENRPMFFTDETWVH